MDGGTMTIEIQLKGLGNNAACLRESGKVSKGAGAVNRDANRSYINRCNKE